MRKPPSLRSFTAGVGKLLSLLTFACAACGGPASPPGPTGTVAHLRDLPLCPPVPRDSAGQLMRFDGLVSCPTRQDVEDIRRDITVTITDQPSPGTLVCTAADGSADLTYAERNLYGGIAFLRHLEFSRPLPWTDKPVYEWFKQAAPHIIIEVRSPGGANYDGLSRTIHLRYYPGFPIDSPVYQLPYSTLVHEARHLDGPPHNCDGNDANRSMMGSRGVEWYLNYWIANYSNQPATVREAATLLNAGLMRTFCGECAR